MTQQSYTIAPGQQLAGDISVPGDKSISHRAVMLGGMANGVTVVRDFLEGEDCRATLRALSAMGVESHREEDGRLIISGAGSRRLRSPSGMLDMGNSGTGMRLLMGLLAGQQIEATLTGDASLRQRPMERVAAPLRLMGADIHTDDGHAPVTLHPQQMLAGISYALPVASAQIKSALMLAGLGAAGRTEIRSPAPTRDHTERMLAAMGVPVDVSADGLTVALDGPADLQSAEIRVPGDLSSAAFFIVGACIGGREPLIIRRVGINPTRDGILTILRLMGARIELENQALFGGEPVADLRVWPSPLHGARIPAELVPLAIDELPVVFVAGAAAKGETVVTGAEELRVKESDRIGIMAQALAATGVDVQELQDGIIIRGGAIRGGKIDSGGDHRVAMSFAMAALVSREPILITDTGPVATSFPNFIDTAAAAGLQIGTVSD